MFYIDQNTSTFHRAKQQHYENVRYVIKKKLLGAKFIDPHPTGLTQKINQVPGIDSRVAAFFNDETRLKELLIGTPDVLSKIKGTFKSKKTIASVKSLIRYDAFTDKKI